ncbi:MAG: motility associated factor glycosyltransferase family protein, partial [Planctomycetota bacterium]
MPPTVATPSLLARTTACLGSRNADLAFQLGSTEPRGDIAFTDTPQGVPAVAVAGTPLCSRHRPLDEAGRLVDRIDLVEHAVIVVLGFGAGYHVQRLAQRLGRGGLIVVFEPDLGLLRTVLERIDHSSWLKEAPVLFVTDPADRGALAAKLEGTESIIAQGVVFLEHPPSRRRLGRQCSQLTTLFSEFVTAAKTTFLTTLMRSVDTIRNLLLNLDHYAAGAGITDLQGAAAGHPAVVVSAGPSLRRNLHRLAPPDVRERCVIIAAQTTLRPLLAAGIRPHFVTALDFHEISQRFYEGITADDVGDTTLVAEPKAHPVILDAFPGPVRCCANDFLDSVLGDLRRPMGQLPAGATVAHLAVYAARYLGCNPIVMIGQDLAFSDGLYYAPGTAIEEVWAPELNPFNTIEMMQWQR